MNENRDPSASILQCHVQFHSLKLIPPRLELIVLKDFFIYVMFDQFIKLGI